MQNQLKMQVVVLYGDVLNQLKIDERQPTENARCSNACRSIERHPFPARNVCRSIERHAGRPWVLDRRRSLGTRDEEACAQYLLASCSNFGSIVYSLIV